MRKTVIVNFLNDLEKSFPYAILHHLESIFETGNDIDLVVNSPKKKLTKFISTYCKENKYYYTFNTIDNGTLRYNVMVPDGFRFIKIELDIIFSNKNIFTLDVKKLINSRVQKNHDEYSLFKINNHDEYEYYIKKKTFKSQNIDTHLDYLLRLNVNKDSSTIKQDYSNYLRLFNSNAFLIKFWTTKLKLIFVRIKENPSLIVGFLGPDGSGKSTIIESLKNENPYINFKYFHLKPKYSKDNQQVDDPHKKKPYSWGVSNLKIIFLIFQYHYYWIKNIIPIKYTPTLIIFDRYFDDILADPKRYRFSGSINLVKFSRYIIPKPNLYFVLITSSDVILSRKREVSRNELEQQLKRYEKVSNSGEKYNLIEVNRTIDEITQEIIFKILNYGK